MDRIADVIWATLIEPALRNEDTACPSDLSDRWKRFAAIGTIVRQTTPGTQSSTQSDTKATIGEKRFDMLHPSALLRLVGTTLNSMHSIDVQMASRHSQRYKRNRTIGRATM